MQRKTDMLLTFAAITAVPTIAFADAGVAFASATNAPWIALALVGMVRAVLCWGHGSFLDEGDDRAR